MVAVMRYIACWTVPVHGKCCGWGSWQGWSSYCGNAQRKRRRKCECPKAAGNGRDCESRHKNVDVENMLVAGVSAGAISSRVVRLS